MLNIIVDYVIDFICKTDGIYILGLTFLAFAVIFVLNLILQKNALRYALFCTPNALLYCFFMMNKGYSFNVNFTSAFILLLLFTICFNILLTKKPVRVKKVKPVEKEQICKIASPINRESKFNYIRQNERSDTFLPVIDTAHAHELINSIKEKPLTYADKTQINEIDYVVNKIDNGITRQACIEFNEAMCMLLKMVAKYNV